jgi:predicted O-methyltransferase YrrM
MLGKNKRLRQLLGGLETANLLGLKLLLKNPKNFAWYPGRVFRTYMRLVGEDRWPCRGLFEIFPEHESVRFQVEYVQHGDGVGECLDWLCYLAFVTKVVQPRAVFEIGTFRGRSALNFALNSPDDCTVYTLDLPPEARSTAGASREDARLIALDQTGIDYRGKREASKIVQLWGDSATFDFTPYQDRIDLVFIDGAHHYQAVARDTEHALSMVRPGGVVIWDNFSQYGDYNDVTRAVLDRLGSQVVQIEDTELAIYRVTGTRAPSRPA